MYDIRFSTISVRDSFNLIRNIIAYKKLIFDIRLLNFQATIESVRVVISIANQSCYFMQFKARLLPFDFSITLPVKKISITDNNIFFSKSLSSLSGDFYQRLLW